MLRFLFLAFSIAIFSLMSACSTLVDAQAAKGSGASKIYNKPYDEVWTAVIETIKASDLALITDNKEKGTILAQGAISAFSWGENVAVFVEDVGERASTRVEVANKRALATNITAKDWESRILDALDKKLGNVSQLPLGADSLRPNDSGFAKVDDVNAVPYLGEKGKDGYRIYLSKAQPRAFAIAPNGAWGWANGTGDSRSRALQNCDKLGNGACALYSVNGVVIWNQAISPVDSKQRSPGDALTSNLIN
jgi:hypothetical protein